MRYRPLLRYDSAERHHAQPISREAEELDGHVVYGREAIDGGEHWLQFWLFYPYNEQDRGILRTGRHEGDWEFLQVRLGETGRPDAATFAQHSWAEACSYGEIEVVETDGAGIPVVYVANGSHASYVHEGTADRPWPDPNDEADGHGPEVRPDLVRIDDSTPWIRDPEPWGSSRAGIVPSEQSSPPGPRFTDDERWRHPARFHEDARPCGSGPPGRPWALPLVVAIMIGAAALVWTLRRRRGSA
jgi:hypothetical protein